MIIDSEPPAEATRFLRTSRSAPASSSSSDDLPVHLERHFEEGALISMALNVVVVGAGVIGAAVAANLARGGCNVTVLESGQVAAGTSGATFAWINAGDKQPRSYFDLNVEGMQAHRRLASSVASCDWYHEIGNLEWITDAEAQQDQERKVTRLLECGYQARWLDPKEVRSLEPDMAPDMIGNRVAYFPDEGWVDPARLVAALLSTARAAGAHMRLHSAAVEMSMTNDRIDGVRTSDGETVRTDAVVNCAGPAAGEVAAIAGLDLPMRNTAGLLAYTAATAVAVGRVIHAPQIHLRPDGGGRLVLHNITADAAVSTPDGGTWITEPGAAQAMLHLAQGLYPGLRNSKVEASRIGMRPIPIDGLPVLGPSATIENFHFAVTHSGVTLCLRVAELVGANVRGEQADELAPFRHSRLDTRQPPAMSADHGTRTES
jgi:glycine/D-amino acid oxidase-like deaminating enzyme